MEDVQYAIVEGEFYSGGLLNPGERVRLQSNGLIIYESIANGKKTVKIYHRASVFGDKVKKSYQSNSRSTHTKKSLTERAFQWRKWQKDVDEKIEAIMQEEEQVSNLQQRNPQDSSIRVRQSIIKAQNDLIKIQLSQLQKERSALDADLRDLKFSKVDPVEDRKELLRLQAEQRPRHAEQSKKNKRFHFEQAEEDEYVGRFGEGKIKEESPVRLETMMPLDNQMQSAGIPHHFRNKTGYGYYHHPLAEGNIPDNTADTPFSGMNITPSGVSGSFRELSHPFSTSTTVTPLDPTESRPQSASVSGRESACGHWKENVKQWNDGQDKDSAITLRVRIMYDENEELSIIKKEPTSDCESELYDE